MTIGYIYNKILKKLRGSAISNSNVHKTSKIESGSVFLKSTMDKYSFCGYDCDIVNTNIGSFCSIANNVAIGGAMHPIDWVSMSPVFYKGRDSISKKFATFDRKQDKTTHIGNDVWIGQYSIIKQGVDIGTGGIIGMGSVVTKNIPPYEIWAGNPAKFIRKRFDDETIMKLSKSEWWLKSDSDIEKMAKDFNNVQDFIKNNRL
jgi:chloramphenicol O-acetyltransferase type B